MIFCRWQCGKTRCKAAGNSGEQRGMREASQHQKAAGIQRNLRDIGRVVEDCSGIAQLSGIGGDGAHEERGGKD